MGIKTIVFSAALVLAAPLSLAQTNAEPVDSTSQSAEVYDPFEGFNRTVFRFNNGLDRFILKPVAKGYRAVTPNRVENGVTNIFGNLGEVGTIVNSVLQWKWGKAGNSTGRFLVNSTVGLVGIFDVAKSIGLPKKDGEDFGQTLATWGVGNGPYLMLPLLGPSNLRDGFGLGVDYFTDPVNYIDDSETQLGVSATRTINTRAQLLEVEEIISGDKYVFFRNAYMQRREFLVKDGEVEDDFGAGSDDFEDFDDFDDIELD